MFPGIEFGVDILKAGHPFGYGTLALKRGAPLPTDLEALSTFTRNVANAHGCPVQEATIAQRGEEAAVRRYGELNYFFREILARAFHYNPTLACGMVTPKRRQEFVRAGHYQPVPVGSYEEESVPKAYQDWQFPLNQHLNYAFTRVFTAFLDADSNPQREQKGFELVEMGLRAFDIPQYFLAATTELLLVVDRKTDSGVLLKQLLSPGLLAQNNNLKELRGFLPILEKYGPNLHRAYVNSTDDDKKAAGIAIIR